MKEIHIEPLSQVACFCDELFEPLMRLGSLAWDEEPQRTHRYNNHHLNPADSVYLNQSMMVRGNGDPKTRRLPIALAHMPIFGGWKKYAVLEPVDKNTGEWYVGWTGKGFFGISRIPINGRVRLLEGPGPVLWFGTNAQGEQVQIRQIGNGQIGDGGQFSQLPLR
ncbi:MAG: hypothetical protein AAB513_02715 [Patescibacteria group bacterium]